MVKGSLKVTVNIISQQKNLLDLLAIDIRKWNITGLYSNEGNQKDFVSVLLQWWHGVVSA